MDPGEKEDGKDLVFNPSVIASHFIHVWVVVSVNKDLSKERFVLLYFLCGGISC